MKSNPEVTLLSGTYHTDKIMSKAKKWMSNNCSEYDNATTLAEEAASEFDLYEDDIDYVIPEWVFEESAKFYEAM